VNNGSVISSFLKSKIPRERKEAFPISLYVVVQWERRILQSCCPTRDIILLGSFLACLYASLRFSNHGVPSFLITRQFAAYAGARRHLPPGSHLDFIVTASSAEESTAGLLSGFRLWMRRDTCISLQTFHGMSGCSTSCYGFFMFGANPGTYVLCTSFEALTMLCHICVEVRSPGVALSKSDWPFWVDENKWPVLERLVFQWPKQRWFGIKLGQGLRHRHLG